jgi:hypothetical protein
MPDGAFFLKSVFLWLLGLIVVSVIIVKCVMADEIYQFDWFDVRPVNIIVINDCVVQVPIDRIKDLCWINKRIKRDCVIDLGLGDKCEN